MLRSELKYAGIAVSLEYETVVSRNGILSSSKSILRDTITHY